jgi:arylsulfatase
VILIVIDTLRADYLGSYGYPRESSPHLDRLAARGVRFDDVTSTAPVTLPSVASILTGLIPPTHGVRDNAGFTLAPAHETLTERFAAAGWRTGAVVSSAVLSADRGLDQGFEIYRDQFGGDYPVFDPSLEPLADQLAADRRRADRTTDLALELIEDFGDRPYFLLVHYFDVHEYYDPPRSPATPIPERFTSWMRRSRASSMGSSPRILRSWSSSRTTEKGSGNTGKPVTVSCCTRPRSACP